tara:strand:+ start:43 stop:279 length:237 start_codon:yes stop_codon:yes gene_type:complete
MQKPTITVDYTFTASLELELPEHEVTDEMIEATMRENIAEAHAEASFSEWEAFDLTHYSSTTINIEDGEIVVSESEEA